MTVLAVILLGVIAVLFVVIALAIIGSFLPSTLQVMRSIVIPAAPESIAAALRRPPRDGRSSHQWYDRIESLPRITLQCQPDARDVVWLLELTPMERNVTRVTLVATREAKTLLGRLRIRLIPGPAREMDRYLSSVHQRSTPDPNASAVQPGAKHKGRPSVHM